MKPFYSLILIFIRLFLFLHLIYDDYLLFQEEDRSRSISNRRRRSISPGMEFEDDRRVREGGGRGGKREQRGRGRGGHQKGRISEADRDSLQRRCHEMFEMLGDKPRRERRDSESNEQMDDNDEKRSVRSEDQRRRRDVTDEEGEGKRRRRRNDDSEDRKGG